MKIRDVILDVLAALILPALIAGAFFHYTSLPDVVFSHETGKCKKVINADGSLGSCDRLPKKYHHYWGK